MLRTSHRHIGLGSALGVAGLALSLASGPAHATVTIQISDGTWGYYATGNNNEHLNSTNPTDGNLVAGSDTVTIASNTLQAYCVDLFHTVNVGSSPSSLSYDSNVQISTSTGYVVTGATTTRNWTQYQVNELTDLLANAPQGSQLNSAALQIAIWEIEYDQGTQLTTGNLNTTLNVTTDGSGNKTMSFGGNQTSFSGLTSALESQVYTDLSNAVAAASTTPPPTQQVFQLFDSLPVQSGDPQSLIYLVSTIGNGNQGPRTPEPGTLGVLGAGLTALWTATRRKRGA